MTTSNTFRDESALRRLLDDAEIVPLVMSLVHLTGDESLLGQIRPYVRGPWDHQISVPHGLASELRGRMAAELVRQDVAGRPAMKELPPDLMQRMMSTAAGEAVNEAYAAMLMEDMCIARQSNVTQIHDQTRLSAALRDFKVLIIGAGASGLCAAIRLGQLGIPYARNCDLGR